MTSRITAACISTAVVTILALAGCGGPATFVSDVPPVDVTTEVHFTAGLAKVRAAVRGAMLKNGLSLEQARCTSAAVLATKTQIPYVGDGVLEPAAGQLPYYLMRAELRSGRQTRVRLSVEVRHVGDRGAPYEWEYPTDLMRKVLDDARGTLKERARYKLPPRYRPTVRWTPPYAR